MKDSQTTKDRILDAAEEIMLEKSFHSVGLTQILNVAKVPKGSFYHYFESKEQFGAEMLKHYMDQAGDNKRRMLTDTDNDSDPLNRLFIYLDGSIDFIQSVAGRFPCLALKLASEVSDISEDMRKELALGFDDWISIFREVLDEAVDKKILPATFDSGTEAQLIQDLWSGSVQRAVINRSSEPVRNAVEHIKSRISSMIVP
ncbi:MAG: TetR/AcrR family transcriptional repressor of nem operon [Desulforhopalus sp.]|jgi:TetR/AcrR family transcriptional repressor of nem operon